MSGPSYLCRKSRLPEDGVGGHDAARSCITNHNRERERGRTWRGVRQESRASCVYGLWVGVFSRLYAGPSHLNWIFRRTVDAYIQ